MHSSSSSSPVPASVVQPPFLRWVEDPHERTIARERLENAIKALQAQLDQLSSRLKRQNTERTVRNVRPEVIQEREQKMRSDREVEERMKRDLLLMNRNLCLLRPHGDRVEVSLLRQSGDGDRGTGTSTIHPSPGRDRSMTQY
jgi:hypothetical protein